VEEHTVVAVDVAKAVFELAVPDEPGRVKLHRRLSRGELAVFLAQTPRATAVRFLFPPRGRLPTGSGHLTTTRRTMT
jgi:hypothetical protein